MKRKTSRLGINVNWISNWMHGFASNVNQTWNEAIKSCRSAIEAGPYKKYPGLLTWIKYNYRNGAQSYAYVNTLITSPSYFPDPNLVIAVPADAFIPKYSSPSASAMLAAKPHVFDFFLDIYHFEIYDVCRNFTKSCVTASVNDTTIFQFI